MMLSEDTENQNLGYASSDNLINWGIKGEVPLLKLMPNGRGKRKPPHISRPPPLRRQLQLETAAREDLARLLDKGISLPQHVTKEKY